MIRTSAGFVAFLLTAAAVGVSRPAVSGPILVAVNRCDSRMISDFSGQIREYEAHPPRQNLGDLQKRFNDINQILVGLGQERGVLESVCSSDAQKAPLFAQIGATAAWGLALESDIAMRIDQPCTPAAKAIAQALLAQAWLDLASPVNDANGTVPADVSGMAPKVQSRAAALSFTLPAYSETSAYWRGQVTDQAKTAVNACPMPAPSASPSPSASP